MANRITFTFARGDVKDAVYALAMRRRCDVQAVINDILARAMLDGTEQRLADELRLVSEALELANRRAASVPSGYQNRYPGSGDASTAGTQPTPISVPVPVPVVRSERKRNPWEQA
jgi:hypothetical protein